jgi:hypothetical protein
MKSSKIAMVLLSLSVAFGAGSAMAQATSGNIMGDAKPGDVVVVSNKDTGWTREVTVKDNGKYSVRSVPTGTYNVEIRHADGSSEPMKQIKLHVGATARVLL